MIVCSHVAGTVATQASAAAEAVLVLFSNSETAKKMDPFRYNVTGSELQLENYIFKGEPLWLSGRVMRKLIKNPKKSRVRFSAKNL
jgi:hypothetical protein